MSARQTLHLRLQRWASCLLLACTPLLAWGQADERAVKAAYLFNFIQFTQWPLPPEDPFRLCVVGVTPMDAALDTLNGKPVLTGQRIRVTRLDPKDSVQLCHLLYIDESQRAFSSDALQRARGLPILTVTDSEAVADRGVMIEIVRSNQRLGFEVNLDIAAPARLGFSARMLKLAAFVRGRSGRD